MIHEALTAFSAALAARLPRALRELPGPYAQRLRGAKVLVSREQADNDTSDAGILIRVEQSETPDLLPGKYLSNAEPVSLAVRVEVWRAKVPALKDLTDDQMTPALRAMGRAIRKCISDMQVVPTLATDAGVTVQAPTALAIGEPEHGTSGDVSTLLVAVTVPCWDTWAVTPF